MKRAILALALTASVALAFPSHTNRFVGAADLSARQNFDDFLWSFSGFDDQVIIADITDITFSNAGFRMSYPKRGRNFVDLVGTNNITTYRTNIVNIVNEVFTQCYSAIVYTNYHLAQSNRTLTVYKYVDYYTNLSINPITTLVVDVYNAASNVVATNSAAACNVYTGTAPTTALSAYGIYTNTWPAKTNLLTSTTQTLFLAVYSSNMALDGTFTYANTATSQWQVSGMATAQNSRVDLTNATNFASVFQQPVFVPYVSGKVYRIQFDLSGAGSVASNDFCGTHTNLTGGGSKSYLATALSSSGLKITWTNASASGAAPVYVDNVVVQEYVADATNITTSVSTNTLAQSNVIVTAYSATSHTNKLYVNESNDYQRIFATLNRTAIPPNGIYYAEFLSWGDPAATNPARSVAKGQVAVEHSLYGNTNAAAWTNPAANTVIGPPVHTLTTLAGWPFPSTVAISNAAATSGSIDDGVLHIGINVSAGSGATSIVGVITGTYSSVDQTFTASFGTNAIAALGAATGTPLYVESDPLSVKKAGDTMTGTLTLSNTTADADLTLLARTDAQPARSGRINFSGRDPIGSGPARLYLYAEGADGGYGTFLTWSNPFTSAQGHIYYAETDGAGSGVDADLLDGTQLSGLAAYLAGTNLTASGDGKLNAQAGGGGVTNLHDLNLVDAVSPSADQVLKYVGGVWTNAADATGGGGVTATTTKHRLIPMYRESSTLSTNDAIFWSDQAGLFFNVSTMTASNNLLAAGFMTSTTNSGTAYRAIEFTVPIAASAITALQYRVYETQVATQPPVLRWTSEDGANVWTITATVGSVGAWLSQSHAVPTWLTNRAGNVVQARLASSAQSLTNGIPRGTLFDQTFGFRLCQ